MSRNQNTMLLLQSNMINLLSCAAILLLKKKEKIRKKRRWWIRPTNQNRYLQGDYHNLLKEMRLQDTEMFFVYTRMPVEAFDYLLSLAGPHLKKSSNRPNISARCRLAVTLRILASGDSLQSAAIAFRMGRSTVCNIFRETCSIIWLVLQPLYLLPPNKETWNFFSEDFDSRWQLPNCVGAVDGKLVSIKPPNNTGSEYYNDKKHCSTILFAVCDANYQFTHVDIGAYDSQSDGGVLRESLFGHLLTTGGFHLPDDKPLPGTNKPVPHFFVGNEVFPLKDNFLRPYSGHNLQEDMRVFNYRLSRARRCIENAFGILAARWQIYHKSINAFPETVDQIIKATVCLHNYIASFERRNVHKNQRRYLNDKVVDKDTRGIIEPGEWRNEVLGMGALQPIQNIRPTLETRNAKLSATEFRNYIKDYVFNINKIEWQLEYIRRTI